jgi:hypothetical protein
LPKCKPQRHIYRHEHQRARTLFSLRRRTVHPGFRVHRRQRHPAPSGCGRRDLPDGVPAADSQPATNSSKFRVCFLGWNGRKAR